MSPECDTCPNSATRAIRDNARGWGNGTKNSPHRNACDDCYAALLADIDPDDPWAREYPTIRTYPKDTTMTTQPDTAPLADKLAPIAAELAAIAADKADLDAREKSLKEQIRQLVPGPDKYDAGGLTITVSSNHRFDAKVAERVLPADLLDLCRISKVDSAAAREVLPPALYEQCMATVGADRISVR